MKEIILTIDYELFFGNKTGTVNECMIEPTEKLALILEKNDSKMTVFWDVLHYYRLIQLENKFDQLRKDRTLIENQILSLVEKGHDIQMHLHPHWLDTQFIDGNWDFNYKKFRLHDLSKENNIENINTIIGCVTISKNLMENIIRKINPLYTVRSFRAGGYLIEPFKEIKEALELNKIIIDSSVLTGMYNSNGLFSYNFINYPNQCNYRFEDNLAVINETGKFIEFPIATLKISVFMNLIFTIIRRIKYPNLESKRAGTGLANVNKINKKSNLQKIIDLLTKKRVYQFTTDNNFRERFDYFFRKVPNYSVMILHPKLLNDHTLKLLDEYLSNYKIKFISLYEYLKIYG